MSVYQSVFTVYKWAPSETPRLFIMYSVAPQLDEEKKYEAGPQPFAMALCMFEVQN